MKKLDLFVAATVEWEYVILDHHKKTSMIVRPESLHGHSSRAWGPFGSEQSAKTYRDAVATLPGFSDVSIILGRTLGDDEHRVVQRGA